MPNLGRMVRSTGVCLIGAVIGMTGIAIAENAAFPAPRGSGADERFLIIEAVDYNLGDHGRMVRSIDATLSTMLSGDSKIRYQLRPGGEWSNPCSTQNSSSTSMITGCRAPDDSSTEGTTRLRIVLAE